IWGAIYRELLKARSRGVEVKIIYDGLGSALRAPLKDFKRLKRAGAQIKVFNRLLPLPVSRLNFRDHRKIAAIDGDAVFLGGVNIADEYANLCSPHGYWKDGGGLFFGEIACVYSDLFLTAFDGKKSDCPRTMRKITAKHSLLPVVDEPEQRGSLCEDLLASAIYSARRHVYIFTPYLCMGDKLCDAIAFAARRGVDVKLIIPHIPDKKLTYQITLAYGARLTDHGAEVYSYTPGFMHFKGVICDDGVLLGSYNFDFRSMRLNYECGVWCDDGVLADEAARDFTDCLAVSEKLHAKRRNAAAKLLSRLLSLFAPLV
ncbi:MAG: phosphatidylserine/phosphatidylglycerophosphate/cardiolipin synthase family protein, partial [Clostridia bacterium]|nr:phosphatidylserine/phosphatidylglycerophosphate/cardiolipin synthase family protein [Clostridia bacterium]